MFKPGIVLIELNEGWKFCVAETQGPVHCVASHDPKTVVDSLLDFSSQTKCNLANVLIAVATQNVFFVRLTADESKRIRNEESLRYAMEKHLPSDAEKVVVDFVKYPDSTGLGSAAVAMEFERLLFLVEELERADCLVQRIVPTTMLALEQLECEKKLNYPSALLMRTEPFEHGLGPTAELTVFAADKTLTAWHVSEFSTTSVQSLLQLADASDLPLYVLMNGSLEPVESIEQLALLAEANTNVSSERTSCSMDHELAVRRAMALFRDRSTPWVDLRKNALAATAPLRHHWPALRRLMLTAAMLIATVCGGLFWKAFQYQREADQATEEQVVLYQHAFPNQRLPRAILSRVRSEHTRVVAQRSPRLSDAFPTSSLPTLYRVLASFKQDYVYEVEEIRIDGKRISIEVKLRSQQDAGRLAADLAKHGFAVAPPSTSLVEGDFVRATLLASAASADSNAGDPP